MMMMMIVTIIIVILLIVKGYDVWKHRTMKYGLIFFCYYTSIVFSMTTISNYYFSSGHVVFLNDLEITYCIFE